MNGCDAKMKWKPLTLFFTSCTIVVVIVSVTLPRIWGDIPRGLDLRGGISMTYRIDPAPHKMLTSQDILATLTAVEGRVNSLGVAEPTIYIENGDQIVVELAGISNLQAAQHAIGNTSDLGIYSQISEGADGQPEPISSTLLISGRDLNANASVGQNSLGQPVVNVTFKNNVKWASVTKTFLGRVIYTFLNGRLISSDRVANVIVSGETSIGPLNSLQAAYTLASQLNAGSLPFALTLLSSTDVGAQLGSTSFHSLFVSSVVALMLIFAFMIFSYRLAGLVATVGLLAYVYLVVSVFAAVPITLTLPGMAALVLGVGMAVDANIITYERIRDELRKGRRLTSAVVAGSRRALPAIYSANITTGIAGAIMVWLGTGDIRGFGIALLISLASSLLTAVVFARSLLAQLTTSDLFQNPVWYGLREEATRQ